MTSSEPQVLIAVVQMVLQIGAALGIDRGELLAEAGLREVDVVDRDGYLPLRAQVELGQALARRRPGVNLGLVGLDYFRVSTLGVLGYVVSHCATLGEALAAFARYQTLLSPAVRWRIDTGGRPRVRIEAAQPLQGLGFPLETQVGAWVVIGRQLTEREWSPVRVRLRHRPAGPAHELAERLGCPVEFGAEVNELELPASVLELPVVGARPELQPSLARLVESLQSPAGAEEFSERVRALLLEELPRGLTTKDEAARRLGVSPRTLGRRLHDDGTSFRELLEEVRRRLAQAWLADPSVAIHEIAYLLGYSDPSAFHRSFRRWTGRTPAAWRRGAD